MVIGSAVARPEPYGAHGHGLVQPGPAVEYSYQAKAPAVKCGHNLLINCNPHHSVVPCKGSKGGHGAAPAHYGGAAGGYGEVVPVADHGHGYHAAPAEEQYRHKKHKKHHGHHHHHHHHHHHGHGHGKGHRDAASDVVGSPGPVV
ncbi:transcription factor MafA-like [Uranotaenia lowii]|uniref:transcription factor MafA-like n=1 Tax=Uranotaenia lowii TaxID=190385 RepID=UPI00247933A8|nr:transcription factor MafA-like [Uranotaenia lowii]